MSKWLKLTEIALRPANTFPGVKFSQWKNEKWECTLFSERNLPFLKYSVLETLGHWPWPNTLRNSPEWMVPATTFMKKGYWPWPRVTRKNLWRKGNFLFVNSVHPSSPVHAMGMQIWVHQVLDRCFVLSVRCTKQIASVWWKRCRRIWFNLFYFLLFQFLINRDHKKIIDLLSKLRSIKID